MANESKKDQQHLTKFEERFPSIWTGHVVIQEKVAYLDMRFLHGHKITADLALKHQSIIGSETIDPLTPMTQEEYSVTASENDERKSCFLLALPYGATEDELRINSAQAYNFLHFIRSHSNYYTVDRGISPNPATTSENDVTLYTPNISEEHQEENNRSMTPSQYSLYLYIPNAFTDSVVKTYAPDWYYALKKKLYFIAVILEKRSDIEVVSEEESDNDTYEDDTEEYDTDEENIDPNLRGK